MKVSAASEAKVVVERSRFFSILFPAASEEDVLAMVKAKKGEHRKANHHCWAFRGIDAAGQPVEKSKDDGEVGHPGSSSRRTTSKEGSSSPASSAA